MNLKEIHAKARDFTGFDFSAWKKDPDTTKNRYHFWFKKSHWGPRPIDVVAQFNPNQSATFTLNPQEFVELYDTMGEFIAEHHLRDHI